MLQIETTDSATNPRLLLRGTSSGRFRGKMADRAFGSAMLLCALSLFLIVELILSALLLKSRLSIGQFGWNFFSAKAWNPVIGNFGAATFLFGTVLSSLLALALAAPPAIAAAVFVLEICPRALRSTVSFLTELLAAVPSVVYGLWALLVLVPLMRRPIGPILKLLFGWTGLLEGPNFGVCVLTASVILAIMIFPIISSVSRDLMRAVPVEQREAALALGATRWEMIRLGVLRNARVGIGGALILGLGRALGETMAVTMVIGNHPAIVRSLFAPGYTMASVIANEFAEAGSDLHLSALMEIGLVLFLVTTVVNAIARLLVWAVLRDRPARAA